LTPSVIYDTDINDVSVPLVFKGLEQGDLDVFVEAWFPTMQVNLDAIDRIDNSGRQPEEVALQWLRENPETTNRWLEGVMAADGTDGAEALRRYLEERSS